LAILKTHLGESFGRSWVGWLWSSVGSTLKAQKGANKGKNHKIVAVADDYLPTPFFLNLLTCPSSSSSSSSFSPLAWVMTEEEDFLTWLGIYVLHNLLLLFTGFQASDWPSPHLSQWVTSLFFFCWSCLPRQGYCV
jgi:hypothetical protein